MIQIVGTDRVRIEVEATQIHDPCQLCRVAEHDLVGGPARWERELDCLYPFWPVVGRALLKEGLLVGAVDEALEGHRPATGAAQRAVRDRQVVIDQIDLGVAGLRKEDLFRVAYRDRAAGDLELKRLLGHLWPT